MGIGMGALTKLHAQPLSEKPDFSELNLENDNDYSSFSLLDSVLPAYNVFFTGENHQFRRSNYMLQLKMLKYLHQKAGVKHLLLEFGYSRGWLVNRYVQTGDTTLFSTLYDYSYREYSLLYKGIYEYNQTLDSADRITVSGIDIERSYTTPVKVLSLLFPTTEPPSAIALHIDAIRALAVITDDKQRSTKTDKEEDVFERRARNRYSEARSISLFLHDADSNAQYYREYLGAAYPDFLKITTGLKASYLRDKFTGDNTVQAYIFREQYMYERFMELVKEYPGEKFYSQFGRCHTSLEGQDRWCGYYYFRSLASRIQQSTDTLVNGKVCAIAAYYPLGSEAEKRMIREDKVDVLLKRTPEKGLVLVRVEADSSEKGKLSDKYQFVILNYNRPAEDVVNADTTKQPSRQVSHSDDEGSITFEYRYGMAGIKLSSLNSLAQIAGANGKNFSTPLLFQGGALTLTGEGVYTSVLADFFTTQRISLSDTSRLSLSGWSVRMRVGADLLRSSRVVKLSPYIGIAYSRLAFEQYNEYPAEPVYNAFEPYRREHYRYVNPAVVWEAGLDLRVRLKFISFALNGGYQLDLSGKQWKTSGGGRQTGLPRTSHGGFYLAAAVGLFFPVY